MIQLTPPIKKSLFSNKRPASAFSFVLDAPVFFVLAEVSLFKVLSIYDFVSHAREKPCMV